MYELGRSIGRIFDDIRDGAVYQVWNARSCRVVGYVYWSCPEWLAELSEMPFTYVYRSRNGEVIKRDFYPLSVRAEPYDPLGRRRRGVLASA